MPTYRSRPPGHRGSFPYLQMHYATPSREPPLPWCWRLPRYTAQPPHLTADPALVTCYKCQATLATYEGEVSRPGVAVDAPAPCLADRVRTLEERLGALAQVLEDLQRLVGCLTSGTFPSP